MARENRSTEAPSVRAVNSPPVLAGPVLPSLYDRIGSRLTIIAILYMLVQAGIVVAMYANDRATLASDFISIDAEQIAALMERGSDAQKLHEFFSQSRGKAFVAYDQRGKRLFLYNPGHLPLGGAASSPDLHEETAREERDGSFFISGLRRHRVSGEPIWIGEAVSGNGFRPFLPAIARELRQHVVVPLIPLGLLLLAFNMAVVRRTLAPLQQAVTQVNLLDPAHTGVRLDVPETVREVQTLVGAINRALDRMEQAMSSLKNFTEDAAHELRTPLSMMMLSVDQLPAGDLRATLKEDVAGMSRLVTQMLDIARADALQIPEAAFAPLDQIGRDEVSAMYPYALTRGRSIGLRSSGECRIRGAPEVIRRALRNLIENALAHTPPGTEVEVVVGPGARICVRDHGPGIPVAIREHVLDRFWRAETTSWSGTGLGLAIVASIMKAHGGRIEIGDAPGGGAVVSLVFARG